MNKKPMSEQLFLLISGFAACFVFFALAMGCAGGQEYTVGGNASRCEIFGAGCIIGETLGPGSSVCRWYGCRGCECLENSIAGGRTGGSGCYSDCVIGDKCTGCYSVGCFSSNCENGLRCAGCVICGEDIINEIDAVDEANELLRPQSSGCS